MGSGSEGLCDMMSALQPVLRRGVAGMIGPRIAGVLFDKYKNYQMAFYAAALLAAVALLCELAAKRPAIPEGDLAKKRLTEAA